MPQLKILYYKSTKIVFEGESQGQVSQNLITSSRHHDQGMQSGFYETQKTGNPEFLAACKPGLRV